MSSQSQIKNYVDDVERMLNTPIVDDDFMEMKHYAQKSREKFFELPDIPKVICLCGSTRFKNEFLEYTKKFTLMGYIVLSIGLFGHYDKIELTIEEKEKLDELHKRKIDLADEVFIINPGGYIGDSTKSEILYAEKTRKHIMYYCY